MNTKEQKPEVEMELPAYVQKLVPTFGVDATPRLYEALLNEMHKLGYRFHSQHDFGQNNSILTFERLDK